MSILLTVLHVVTCLLLIIAVLLQSGKGAELSTTLGGSSQTVFGSSGGVNVVARFTAIMAGIFMVTSIGLTIAANQSRKSIFEKGGTVNTDVTQSAAAPENPASNTSATVPSGSEPNSASEAETTPSK